MLKISASYLEKQKSFIPKPKVNWSQHQNKPALFTDLIFSDGLGSRAQIMAGIRKRNGKPFYPNELSFQECNQARLRELNV